MVLVSSAFTALQMCSCPLGLGTFLAIRSHRVMAAPRIRRMENY